MRRLLLVSPAMDDPDYYPQGDPDADDVTYESTTWNPRPEQFRRYLSRELEMARDNLRGVSLGSGSTTALTLHSRRTVAAALRTP